MHRNQRIAKTFHDGSRRGLTVLELLVTMFLIGVLLSIFLPAVQSAREAARRTQCQNNLHQLGLALHLHHDTFQRLPVGWSELGEKQVATGWVTDLLPFLEQEQLGAKVRSDWPEAFVDRSPVTGSNASDRRSATTWLLKTPGFLLCPSDVAEETFWLYRDDPFVTGAPHDPLSDEVLMELPQSNYVGISGYSDPDEPFGYEGAGAFVHRRILSFRDFTKGLSQVAVISERTARKLPSTWLGFHLQGEDAPGRVLGFCHQGPNSSTSDECELDSRHPGGVVVLFADGHVDFVTDSVDSDVYRKMAMRAE